MRAGFEPDTRRIRGRLPWPLDRLTAARIARGSCLHLHMTPTEHLRAHQRHRRDTHSDYQAVIGIRGNHHDSSRLYPSNNKGRALAVVDELLAR
jgi:hypothetical protein